MSNLKFASFVTEQTDGTSHTIKDQEVMFFPLPWSQLFKMREVITVVSSSIAMLASDTRNDTGSTQRVFEASQNHPGGQEIVVEPANERVLAFRSEQQKEAIESIFGVITSDSTIRALTEMVMDSIEKDFWGDGGKTGFQEFHDRVPLPVFIDMIIGTFKANKGVLGPLAGRLTEQAKKAQDLVDAKLGSAVAAAEGQMNQNQSQTPTQSQTDTGGI